MAISPKNKSASQGLYGHLAVLKLLQIAGYDATLGGAAKRVLMIIAGYSDKDGVCWPSILTISKRLQLSRAAVHKQIKVLEEHGYITVSRRFDPNTKAKRSSLIQLNLKLAQENYLDPHVFCQDHVTLVVTYLATLLGYIGMEPNEDTEYVTSLSSKKKKEEKEQIENKTKKTQQ